MYLYIPFIYGLIAQNQLQEKNKQYFHYANRQCLPMNGEEEGYVNFADDKYVYMPDMLYA